MVVLNHWGMPPMRWGPFLAACALGAGLGTLGRPAEPTVVTVRLIDARNGRPYTLLTKTPLTIFLHKKFGPGHGFDTMAEARADDAGTIRRVPDANGQVTFTLPQPMPGIIELFTYPIGCGHAVFDVREVVEKGVVGKNECRTKFAKRNVKFEAKPGEIIYFVAPLSFWERVDRAIFF